MSRYRLEALPVTLLREYAWCPRAAFFKIHGLWEPTTWSMAGGRYDAALLEKLLRRHGVEGRLLLLEYPWSRLAWASAAGPTQYSSPRTGPRQSRLNGEPGGGGGTGTTSSRPPPTA